MSKIPFYKGIDQLASRFSLSGRRYIFRRGNLSALVVGVLIIIVIALIGNLVIISDARDRLQMSWGTLTRIISVLSTTPAEDLTRMDFDQLAFAVQRFHSDVEITQQHTRFLRGVVNVVAPDQRIPFGLMDSADELMTAIEDILVGLEPGLFFLYSGSADEGVTIDFSSAERIIDLLTLGHDRFASAEQHLATARASFDSLALDNASPEMLSYAQAMETTLSQFEAINTILFEAPDLFGFALGLDESRYYLMLGQNNDELRPSGGYISAYGWMQIQHSRIERYRYYPTTSISPSPPPDDSLSEITIPDWWFEFENPITAAWDGSWYADFQETAEMAAWYYEGGDNLLTALDGVIAIDMTGFEYLLEALGDVTLDEPYAESVTTETFRDIAYSIRIFGEAEDYQSVLSHEQHLAMLYRQMLDEWRDPDRQIPVNNLFGILLRALQEKHIMLYFKDEKLAQAVEILGWGGAQHPATAHDYLMVADANLSNKSNHIIARQLLYSVDIQPDNTLTGDLTLVYDYSAQEFRDDPAINPNHYNNLDYINMVQVFSPPGSMLHGSDNLWGSAQQVDTPEYTNYVALMYVPFHNLEHISFTYSTPPLVEEIGAYRRYRLLVQKQPGTHNDSLTVQVSLPSGARLISASQEAAATYDLGQMVLEFQASLTTDQWIEVIYEQG